jgi:hypothetical protein
LFVGWGRHVETFLLSDKQNVTVFVDCIEKRLYDNEQ